MGKEPQAWPAPGSALVTGRFLGAVSSLWLLRLAEENTRPDPVKAAQVTDCYLPQLFLSLRLLAMVVCRLLWRGAVTALVVFSRARRFLAVKRLCARSGRSSLRF